MGLTGGGGSSAHVAHVMLSASMRQTIYLEIEAVLDRYRRAGVDESAIAAAIAMAATASQTLEQLGARFGRADGARR